MEIKSVKRNGKKSQEVYFPGHNDDKMKPKFFAL